MEDSIAVAIPLVNPNEPEALLASLHVHEGQKVEAGDPICTLETTKSTAELSADASGYIVGLRYAAGQTVLALDILCYIATTPSWQPPTGTPSPAEPARHDLIPAGLRITQPAIELAHQLNLPLDQLPRDQLITGKTIRAMAKSSPSIASSLDPGQLASSLNSFDPTSIIIYGAGGHGKTLVELIKGMGVYRITGILDDNPNLQGEIMGIPILGGAEVLPGLYEKGTRLAVNAVGGIGNLPVRLRVFQRLAEVGFSCPAVVHPRAFLESSARLAGGVQVFAQAYVGSDVQVGYGTIINTGAIISHDCLLGDYVNISPGAILAGQVEIGSQVLVGMGATFNLHIKVGEGARIGNGATVKEDVPAGAVVRAGSIWREK